MEETKKKDTWRTCRLALSAFLQQSVWDPCGLALLGPSNNAVDLSLYVYY